VPADDCVMCLCTDYGVQAILRVAKLALLRQTRRRICAASDRLQLPQNSSLGKLFQLCVYSVYYTEFLEHSVDLILLLCGRAIERIMRCVLSVRLSLSLLVCPIRTLNWKTKSRKKNKICKNVPQAGINQFANFEFKRVKVIGRQKHRESNAYGCDVCMFSYVFMHQPVGSCASGGSSADCELGLTHC